MACEVCWTTPPKMHSYLVHLSNDQGESHDIIVQTPCTHNMQEWVDEHAVAFPIANPKVIHIDAETASHVPIVSPAN